MTVHEGIRTAQFATRHYAMWLEEEAKKRVCKSRSIRSKASMKAKAKEYHKAADILLDVANNWDNEEYLHKRKDAKAVRGNESAKES